MKALLDSAKHLQDKQTKLRRDFHHFAEAGWTEVRTASIIAKHLIEMGYEVKMGREVIAADDRMGLPSQEELDKHYQRAMAQGAIPEYAEKLRDGFTGVVAILRNGAGPIIGMRFDIDAVEMNEPQGNERRPGREGFASVNPSAMHSCGHDGHATIGLGVAELLMEYRDHFSGTIKLVFQQAEEGVRGAKSIVGSGILDDVQYMLGSHIGNGAPVGTFTPGQDGMLATSKLDAIFTGKAAHAGGNPDGGKNALLAAATAVMNLYAIPRHKFGATRINVGRLQAGTGRNVIPDRALMSLETRGETSALNQHMYDYAMRILKTSAEMHDCGLETKSMGAAQGGISNRALMARVAEIAKNLGCFHTIATETGKVGGSEDYTYMMERVEQNGGQAIFMGLGAKLGGGGSASASAVEGGAHTIDFDFDESCMPLGSAIFTAIALELAKK
jgi:aminobenzoyl-glutamate utilization protein A